MASFEPKPFGRYVLLEKLAVGGMAEIYKAKTFGVDGFEKLLAIKRILPHCAADKEFIHMLVDEAKLTVLLSHANIVQVYDLGKVGDDYFISMEFINGTNLREMMTRLAKDGKPIPEEIAVYIVSEVCKGLDYAHRKTDNGGHPLNLVHRDISPQNMLISYEGEIKIVDFGIAKAAHNVSQTMAGILKGKIAYMSPEQALGKPIDNRTDVFSTGVVLYELLTGEKLFQGDTQFEVLRKIRTTRIDPSSIPDIIPEGLKRILAKALAYQPKDRYKTAGDFQIELTRYLYSSYVDFSPRQLSTLLHSLFEKELAEKKGETTPLLNEKTRSVILEGASREEIVVHRGQTLDETRAAKPMEGDEFRVTLPGIPKARSRQLKIGGGIAAGLLLFGLVLYQGFKAPSTSPVPPVTGEQPKESAPTLYGSLRVTTEPKGAAVFLNDKKIEEATPTLISNLEIGETYHLRVVKEKYYELEKEISLASDETLLLEGKLEPLPLGVVEIRSNPSGAGISFGGVDLGRETPARIESLELNKVYPVKLSKEGFMDWTSSTELKDFAPVKLQADLVKAPRTVVSIKLNSSPLEATVYLNGKKTEVKTPVTLTKLDVNQTYAIILKKEGYNDWTGQVDPKEKDEDEIFLSPVLSKIVVKKAVVPPEAARPAVVEKPVPPPAPPKEEKPSGPVKYAKMRIETNPSKADVYLNSEYQGTSPVTVKEIIPGTVRFTVSKEGYLKESRRIKIEPGEYKKLKTIELQEKYGEIKIESTPPRATVTLDGETIGPKTPVTIKRVPRDRDHTLRLQVPGYKVWEKTFDMRKRQVEKFSVPLEKE
ncbi:MAG: serine/threonine-protein kinase [bacterium]|nr:serine/threonine-protein kinase [bacterium]